MKLPGAEEEEIDGIMELIDKTEEEGKVLKIEANGSISKRQNVYATYLYETEDYGKVYYTFVPENMKNRDIFGSKKWLHDFMTKQYEAEVIDIEEVEDDFQDRMEKWEEKENPFESVHVFVKHTDDGRYKDEWKYYRGEDEYSIREEEGLPEPQSDKKFVYICLGNIKEVRENADEYDFDFKQTGGRFIPIDLMTLGDRKELKQLREKASAGEE